MIEELNKLTRELTGFTSFPEMCNSVSTTYRPSLLVRGKRAAGYRKLADAYDLVMACKGDARRAYRGIERQTFRYIKLDSGDYDVYTEDGVYIGLVWHIGYGSYPWRNNRSNTGCATRVGAAEHLARLQKGA